MMDRIDSAYRRAVLRLVPASVLFALLTLAIAPAAVAQSREGAAVSETGGEAGLRVPDLGVVRFGGVSGSALLIAGLVVCVLGLVFGLVIYGQLRKLPVHEAMQEISELIYETCKTYLITQGKLLLVLEAFIGIVIVIYFGVLLHFDAVKVAVILAFSLIGIAGSYGVAWFGMRINTFANSRTAFASLAGRPLPVYEIPLKAGMSVGMLLVSVELFMMLCILLFIPGDYSGPCVIGVALIAFILVGVKSPIVQVQLLVWIFVMRILMILTSGASYVVNAALSRARYAGVDQMNFEAPLTSLVWLTSMVSVAVTYVASYLLVRDLGDGSLWWKLSTVISCGTLAGAIIPEFVKIFTSTDSAHVREVVASAREGGASLDILSGFVAGNFSAYWLGLVIVILMGIAYGVSTLGLGTLMIAPAVFAFGLVAFGFLGMGPVTIAVDSYGPVTDNAQSVFELSLIEQVPNIKQELKKDYNIDVNFERAKEMLEANDGAGNTFKATAKPV